MFLTSETHMSYQSPPLAIRDKTTTNKWIYKRSHKSLNSYSLVKYNKIYHNTNSWKTLQEESLWQVDFENLYFWNTLNKTHQSIFVWNINNRLHTNNKKHLYKYRKETTHERVGERKTYINNIEEKISTIYVYKWSQDRCTRTSKHSPKMKHISHLQRNVFLPLTCRILKKETTYSPQFLPLFVMIDKGYKKLESFTRKT